MTLRDLEFELNKLKNILRVLATSKKNETDWAFQVEKI